MGVPIKQELRALILDRIKAQKEDIALFKNRVIFEKVAALPVFRNARTIMFYASFRGEVDTFALMQHAMARHQRVALPVVRKEEQQIVPMLIESLSELKSGAYGIKEPLDVVHNRLDVQELDLVFVPAVAFDRHNNRLGRGAGYYDKFLSRLPVTVPAIGLAYDLQVVEALEGLEAHDRPVSFVITN